MGIITDIVEATKPRLESSYRPTLRKLLQEAHPYVERYQRKHAARLQESQREY